MSNEEVRASNLLQSIKGVDFFLSMVFMKNILYKMKVVTLEMQEIRKDALEALESMKVTKVEFERIRKSDEEVKNIISLAEQNGENKGVNIQYEFEKQNRSKLYRYISELQEETRSESIRKQFFFHYRAEIYKDLNRLLSDLTDIINYMDSVIASYNIAPRLYWSMYTRS